MLSLEVAKANGIQSGIDLGQTLREEAELLGDRIFEVSVTSVGSVVTLSQDDEVKRFVTKCNDVMGQSAK